METIRLGLIGCGGMMSTHVIGVKYVEHVEIVAVCDIIEEKAQKVADALGGTAKVFTKYVDMVDMVDAVMIALPHDLHFECGMFFAMACCQVKCNTSPKKTSKGESQPKHLRGLRLR